MTNKIIDADALEKLTEFCIKQKEISQNIIDSYDIGVDFVARHTHRGCVVIANAFIEKINELATPAPEPQESVDAEGWCWDLDLAPKDGTDILVFVESSVYGTSWQAVASYTFIKYSNGENSEYKEFMSPLGDGQQPVDSCTSKIKAWQPLPKLPTGGNE
jgi:hypothetical protein